MPKIPEIFINEDFKQKQEIKNQQDDEINDKIDLKYEVDAGEIPREIKFYFGAQKQNFFLMCSKLKLNNGNENFTDCLPSDIDSQILKENMLSIHI